MDVVYRCCCGIDVHKKSLSAHLLRRGVVGREDLAETRKFGTSTRELLGLSEWLGEAGCTHVALESTGVYWKPILNIVEAEFEVILANAKHIKNVPGRKNDVRDCLWIAELLQHGLIKASFIPPREFRELPELSRARKKVIEHHRCLLKELMREVQFFDELIEEYHRRIEKHTRPFAQGLRLLTTMNRIPGCCLRASPRVPRGRGDESLPLLNDHTGCTASPPSFCRYRNTRTTS